MAIPFNPPNWLIQDYLSRKSPAQQASEGIGSALQTYAQMKQQEKSQASLDAMRKATEFKAVADYVPEQQIPEVAKQYGITIPTQQTNPGQISPQQTNSPQPSLSSDAVDSQTGQPMSVQSPILAHWNSTVGQGQPPIQSSPNGMPPLGPRPTSKAGLEKYQKNLAMTKTEGEMASKTPITKEDLLASGKPFDPMSQMIVEPGTPRLDLGTKEDQFYQKEWDKLLKETDPLNASSRTPLGLASRATFQANRALKTLSKPMVTNQEAGNSMADIAAIYQNGSPTQFGMSHQEYSTLYGKAQGLLQLITGKPQDAVPEPIKKRLTETLDDMKITNQALLKQRLDLTERSKSKVISKFPDEWKDYRKTLEGDAENYSGLSGGAVGATGPHGDSVTQNNHVYNWNPQTKQYE